MQNKDLEDTKEKAGIFKNIEKGRHLKHAPGVAGQYKFVGFPSPWRLLLCSTVSLKWSGGSSVQLCIPMVFGGTGATPWVSLPLCHRLSCPSTHDCAWTCLASQTCVLEKPGQGLCLCNGACVLHAWKRKTL